MDRQDLQVAPAVLESIVSFDWASPTLPECKTFDIHPERLHSRITYREKGTEVWIIEGNSLRIIHGDEIVHHGLILNHR